MAFCRRWLLIFSTFVLGGGSLSAGGVREDRAFATATTMFQDENWSQAETELADFIQRFPKSAQVPPARLLEAQAQFKQGKFAAAGALLAAGAADAGSLADRYAYWLGEVQFAQQDFARAAETLVALARNFPGSPLALTAVVEAAAAYARLGDWPRHDALLEAGDGVFARAAQLNPDNPLVASGRLSLARSKLERRNFAAAGKILDALNPQTLKPEQNWERLNLLYQVQLGLNDPGAALSAATNLLAAAQTPEQFADGVALHAAALEKKNLLAEATAAWAANLTNAAPAERQQEAVLKIAALAAAQGNSALAEDKLENLLTQFAGSPVSGLALLTLGELHLKDYAASLTATNPPAAATNHLAAAQARFDQLLGAGTNNPLAGKGHLDRGWCEWLGNDMTNSLADFETAARLLPPSADRAVAEFKAGDARFVLQDFAGARRHYEAVRDEFGNIPEVAKSLGDRALYQILRADLNLADMAGAEAAMRKLLADFPASDFADNSLLLAGEAFTDFGLPEKAREVFQQFATLFPDSPLAPQVALAVARTYERGQNWPAAITNYETWLKTYPRNDLQPQVQYALGRADFQAGRETNAFRIFSGLVAAFPTNDLAPLAQWWVADYCFRSGTNYQGAEKNYELIFQTPAWKNSGLVYPAQLMAGRAAMGRLGFSDANAYFAKLLDPASACPVGVKDQTRLAYAASLMQTISTDTNNALANFQLATNVLGQIPPTNQLGLLALSETGDCNLQLGALDAATNAYAQVANSIQATARLRGRARVGWAGALEKMAETAPPATQKELKLQALNLYRDVVYDPTANGFWAKKAGLQALPLFNATGDGNVDKFIDRLETLLPPLKELLEQKRTALKAGTN